MRETPTTSARSPLSNQSIFTSLVVAGLLAGCCLAVAQESPHVASRSSSPQYVAGELIVKLKPEAGEVLEAALHAGQPPVNTGLAWFDALNVRYEVSAIQPLFAHQPDVAEITRKYPQRSRRAPPGAKAPSLQYLYKLTMRQDVNVLQAASDYAAHPDVEYAQPNSLVTIQ